MEASGFTLADPITKGQAIKVLEYFYAKACFVQQLEGEVDYNFKVSTQENDLLLLKISRPGHTKEEFMFQNELLNYLDEKELPFITPKPCLSIDNKPIIEVKDELDQIRFIRLQTWVEGQVIASVEHKSNEVLQAWGRTSALMTKALDGYSNSFADRYYKWDPSNTLESRNQIHLFDSDYHRQIADYFWSAFQKHIVSTLASLRKSINHNDLHESNILINSGPFNRIVGVIDFGDALYTQTINELAIATAYAGMKLPDPLTAICQLTKAYHDEYPLEEQEIEVLYHLIAARLLITVSSAAKARHEEPDNKYLQVSDKDAWELLEKWYLIDSNLAHYSLREACGMDPYPNSNHLKRIKEVIKASHSIIKIGDRKVARMDLSAEGLGQINSIHIDNLKAFEREIKEYLDRSEAQLGIGGYAEERDFYTSNVFREMGNNGNEWRTVHLGIDVWCADGESVYSPLPGIVFAVHDNRGEKDYGPTIILEHLTNTKDKFYTLYGHLDPECLDKLKKGQEIRKGQRIAFVGGPPSNGNWPAHLHFQWILDLLNYRHDFPGVAFEKDLKTWLSICPDPQLFFRDFF